MCPEPLTWLPILLDEGQPAHVPNLHELSIALGTIVGRSATTAGSTRKLSEGGVLWRVVVMWYKCEWEEEACATADYLYSSAAVIV